MISLIFSTLKCQQALDCNEAVVDVQFDASGELISVLLEHSGLYLYSAGTSQLLANLRLPLEGSQSTPRRTWTAFSTHILGHSNQASASSYHPTGDKDPKHFELALVATSSHGEMFSWFLQLPMQALKCGQIVKRSEARLPDPQQVLIDEKLGFDEFFIRFMGKVQLYEKVS